MFIQETLFGLIQAYQQSTEWAAYAPATKKQREYIFKHILLKAGDKPFCAITKKIIVASLAERHSTPAAAANFLKALQGLFKWAVVMGYCSYNPCEGVKLPKLTNPEGFPIWLEEEVCRYQQTWLIGTKERVWLDVLLYTGLRRGDAVRIGKKDVTNGLLSLKTEKSGFKTEVIIPLLPILQHTLDNSPIGESTFICGHKGKGLTKESFGNKFRIACRKAGVNKTAHGLRKLGATRAANAGATVAQLKAIFGWNNDAMASHYTKTADKKRLAQEAMEKLLQP